MNGQFRWRMVIDERFFEGWICILFVDASCLILEIIFFARTSYINSEIRRTKQGFQWSQNCIHLINYTKQFLLEILLDGNRNSLDD